MPITHLRKPFAAPANAILWRYMSLPKLILLLRGELHLTPLSDFEDAQDGMTPPDLIDTQRSAMDQVFSAIRKPDFIKDVARDRRRIDRSRTQRQHEQTIRTAIRETDAERKRLGDAAAFRRGIAASCWHRKSSETIPMWEIYAGRDAGLAVKSSVARLVQSLQVTDLPLDLGSVVYNYDQSQAHELVKAYAYFPALLKGRPFEYEAEVRVLDTSEIWNPDGASPGTVQCLPEILIDEIVVSPFVPQHVGDAIDTAVHALSSARIVPSKLNVHYPGAWQPRYRWHSQTS